MLLNVFPAPFSLPTFTALLAEVAIIGIAAGGAGFIVLLAVVIVLLCCVYQCAKRGQGGGESSTHPSISASPFLLVW